MKVFITGASGYIGFSVAKAFRNAGHRVIGLVRNDQAALNLKKNEIEPVISEISNPQLYATTAKECNVLVHCAFENSKEGVLKDVRAIQAMVGYAKESDLPKVILYTSGVWVYGSTGSLIADESTTLDPIDLVNWRPNHEDMFLKSASRLIKPIVIRPGIVFGGKGGLTHFWFEDAMKGSIPLYGNGNNRLAMIHVEDLATLYVAAAEKELGPIVLNAVDQSHLTSKDCIEAIANFLQLPEPYNFQTEEDAKTRFGSLSQGLLLDQRISAERASRLLGWRPKHENFAESVKVCFEAWKAQL